MNMLLANGDEEIKVEVDFDYQPFEPMTRHYPGCPEEVSICTVTVIETGEEICLLDEGEMEEKIFDKIHKMDERY